MSRVGKEGEPGVVPVANRRRRPRGNDPSVYLIAPISGLVTDLGPGGFCVESWEPLAVNRNYAMLIGETGERAARLACRVEWCRLVRLEKTADNDVLSIYRTGVSYLGCAGRATLENH